MSDLLNPYIAGAPVTDARMFFGREDIFEWIERNLTGQYADHILVVHGQRRVGKTSVLKQLPHRLPQRYIPVFFDLQGRTRTSLDRFLWWLAREIVRVLKQDHNLVIPLPEKEDFSNDPEFLESRFLPMVQEPLEGRRLLLTFDEFDTLEEEEVREALGKPLVDYLRRLMGREGLNFIFSIGSSGRKLENMQASYTEFFKAALYKKVSFLSPEQARHLITSPVEGVLRYERDAVDRIVEITSGHPYFTQLTCHELFALSQRSGSRVIRKQDLEAVLDEVVERGTVNLKFVWDEASDLEKWVLAGLAHAEGKLDSRSLADFLKKQRVRFSPPDLEGALLHLREKDVLTESHGFVIHLLRLWLVRNRPLQQVREELTEVNPIANRYIEIGHEYQESGQHSKALESYREALGVDADNILAQVSVANVYLQQKAYAEAVAEFERALAIDEEDVAARAGLCQTHLLLGDQAVAAGKLKEAIRSYQKVLAINAEHTEARQRMADIKRQQAERSLTDGKDEEALAAFKEALGYTPEDQALEARYTEVLEERKARILADLLVRAERELGARQWDRASATVRSGLELAPNDERFTRVLQRLQQGQREERIAGLRSRAAQAAKQERWEEGISALEEVLRIEPGLQDVQSQLSEARRLHRESRIRSLRGRAQTATRSEKFDEAVAAWQELLTLQPEEDVSIRDEMQRVEKCQAWAAAYSQAQGAMARRNYDRAISMLKGIVVEDETYKDASRLMAEAIELRRKARKFWQSKWFVGAATGVVLTAAGIAISRLVVPLLAPAPAVTEQATSEMPPPTAQAATSEVSLAPPPTATAYGPAPTAIPLAWARLSSGLIFPREIVTAIVVDPSDPGVLYVGTQGAGVYKSIDGGTSWQPASNGLGSAEIRSLVIDPQEPSTLYAGNVWMGVYKTTDGAATWQASFQQPGSYVGLVAMDPQDSRHLMFLTGDKPVVTYDGGATWSEVHLGCGNLGHGTLAFNPNTASELFISQAWQGGPSDCDEGIYHSMDGGQTWALTWLQGVQDIQALARGQGPMGETSLYASTNSELHLSRDGGATWEKMPFQCPYGLAVDAENQSTAYCGGSELMRTLDGGLTWKSIPWPSGGWIRSLALGDGTNPRLLVGSNGLSISTDNGASWSEQSNGLGSAQTDLRTDLQDSGILYATSECSHFRSPDAGETWEPMSPDVGCQLSFGSDGRIYSYGYGQLKVSTDRGDTWEGIGTTPREVWFAESNPFVPGLLYLVPAKGEAPYLYWSDDEGETWQGSTGMEWNDGPQLYFAEGQGGLIYAVGGKTTYRSDDAGKTWAACGGQGHEYARSDSRLAIDPQNSNRVLLGGHGEGVFISEDGCQTWTQRDTGLQNTIVDTVAIDPNDPDTFYAGTDGGAYVSFDGGKSWGPINDGLLGATVIYSIVVDPQSNVYAATPYGVFRLEAR